MSPPFEQQSSINMRPLPSSQPFQSPPHPQQQQQSSLSMLQRAIQQSDQQFNTNQMSFPMSNGFMNVAPFQPFDLIPQTTSPGFPIGATSNQVPLQHQQQQQQSPIQSNNIRMNSPQAMSCPSNVSHNTSPSQNPVGQQTNSPRMSGGSTLQFVPSQVLRKMSKSHK